MLYEISESFKALFDEFEAIQSWEPDEDENGNFIDDDGNIIEDVVEFKENMLQAWYDTLESIECEFDTTAEALALYIKELNAMANAIDIEKRKLALRQEAYKRRAERLQKYLLESMQGMNRKKVETPKIVITTRNNAESVTVSEENMLIDWAMKNNNSLLNYPKPKISKTAVKNAIKNGQAIPYAQVVRTQSVIIK